MPRRFVTVLTTLAWGAWFGGLLTLFTVVSVLFRQDRDIAVEAAPRMFATFERYQLIVAAVALIGTAVWRLVEKRVVITAMFTLLALATFGAVAEPVLISNQMQRLRLAGETSSPRFKQLHGRSMLVYTGEAVMLLGVGLLLPGALRPKLELPSPV